MKNIKTSILIVFVLLRTYSCYKEDAIIPSASENSERFIFPQGNSAFNLAAKAVYDEFGVKIIYKDFKDIDFNLSWTNPAFGKIGYDIPEDQQQEAVNFVVNHIFEYLNPKITSKVLPPYFYVADSIHQRSDILPVLESVIATTYFYAGLDFWSFTWNGKQPWTKILSTGSISYSAKINRPTNSFEYFYRRGVMLKEIYKKAVTIGNIIVPENFNSGFDFTTAVKYASGTENDVNYYKKRGFPGQMTNITNFNITSLSVVSRTGPTQNFIDYLHLCMRYTPDSIEVLYPVAKYPVIHSKYPVVIKYMKDNYGIDLTEIAKKPQI